MNDKITKKELRKFGIVFGLFLCSFAAYHHFKEETIQYLILGIGSFVLLSGLFFSVLIKPLYFTMRFIFRMFIWIVTRTVLVLAYTIIVIPLGIIMRSFGKDPMNRKIEKDSDSYWIKRIDTLSEEDYLTRQY